MVAQGKPDILICDILVGTSEEIDEINGFEAIKMLKEDERTKNIPSVILSNLGQEEDIKKGLAVGALDYFIMAKNTPAELIEKIKDSLKGMGYYDRLEKRE